MATVSVAISPAAREEAGIAAVSVVLLVKVVERAAPSRLATEAAMKPVPVMVTLWAAEPATMLAGVTAVMPGVGLPADGAGGGVGAGAGLAVVVGAPAEFPPQPASRSKESAGTTTGRKQRRTGPPKETRSWDTRAAAQP